MHTTATAALSIARSIKLDAPEVRHADDNTVLLRGTANVDRLFSRLNNMYGPSHADEFTNGFGVSTWFLFAEDKTTILGTVVARYEHNCNIAVNIVHLEFYKSLDQQESLRKYSDAMQTEVLDELNAVYGDQMIGRYWNAVHDFLKSYDGWIMIVNMMHAKRDPIRVIKHVVNILKTTV